MSIFGRDQQISGPRVTWILPAALISLFALPRRFQLRDDFLKHLHDWAAGHGLAKLGLTLIKKEFYLVYLAQRGSY